MFGPHRIIGCCETGSALVLAGVHAEVDVRMDIKHSTEINMSVNCLGT